MDEEPNLSGVSKKPAKTASPLQRSSPAPPSTTYSPFLIESYNMTANLGLSAAVHGFSSPASFFSGCPEDAHSEEDIYSSLSHLPSSSHSLIRQTPTPQQRREEVSDEDDEDDEEENEVTSPGLWNCLVCTRLNQNDQCVFCGQEREKPFGAQKHSAFPSHRPRCTAIGYDDRMRLHREVQPRDMYDLHPERPDRIAAIYEQCQLDGIVDRCTHIPSVMIDKSDLLRCHSDEYLEQLDDIFQLPFHHITPDTYCCRDTDTAAKLSAGIVMSLMEKVIQNEIRNGFAIVRPPGHHAEPDHAMGFCMFNNVAVAARAAVSKYGLRRILILDWDIHHGNGTEHMFEEDPTVMYCSLHRYDNNGAFYPGTGDPSSVGKGAGVGYNINIGWPSGGIGDAEYLAAFDRVLMPVFRSFAPQLVLVSAGFDSALGDPLGRCRLTPTGYAHMTHLLSSLAHGKIVLALEGGYNLKSIAHSASACIRVLLGDAVPPFEELTPPMESALKAIETTREFLVPYWPCLVAVEADEQSSQSDDQDSQEEMGTENHADQANNDRETTRRQSSDHAALVAKIERAERLDVRITQDIQAKLHEKRRQRYRPYSSSYKRK